MNETHSTFDDEDALKEASGETTTYNASTLFNVTQFDAISDPAMTTSHPSLEENLFPTTSAVTSSEDPISSGDITTSAYESAIFMSQSTENNRSTMTSSQMTDAIKNSIISSQATVDFTTAINDSESSSTLSAPILAVVAILAFVTILLFFGLFVRFYFCKRASYYVNESQELKPLNNGNTEQYSQPVGSTEPEKEYLV